MSTCRQHPPSIAFSRPSRHPGGGVTVQVAHVIAFLISPQSYAATGVVDTDISRWRWNRRRFPAVAPLNPAVSGRVCAGLVVQERVPGRARRGCTPPAVRFLILRGRSWHRRRGTRPCRFSPRSTVSNSTHVIGVMAITEQVLPRSSICRESSAWPLSSRRRSHTCRESDTGVKAWRRPSTWCAEP